MKHRRRSTLRASAPHLPLGWWPFFVCTSRRTARKRTAGPLPHPFRIPRYPRDRLKPPQDISWRSLGHPRHPFLLMCRTALSRNLTFCRPCLISWASAGKEAPMPAVCIARWGMSLSGHPRTFRSRRGWISAVWRGDRCGSPTYWPRQDARRSPDGWSDDETRLQSGSGRAQTSLERPLGVRPACHSAPGVFLRRPVGACKLSSAPKGRNASFSSSPTL